MKRLISLLLACVMALGCAGASAETVKHERVYVVTGADGEIRSLTDNVRLENKDALEEIVDRTQLRDVQNVGGHETFTLDGETLTWQARGKDITYQGASDSVPALLPRVTLTLDGQKVTAEELKDKTGEATLEVSYDTEAETPALAVTLVLLPESGVSDITTENAAVLSEAGRQLLVGWAVPGVDESVKLPASFSAAFQADHADLSWMMTLVTTSPIEAACKEIDEKIDFDAHLELDEAEKLLIALEKGEELPETAGKTSEIAPRINELNDGLVTLDDSASQLADGAAQLADGAETLKDAIAQAADGAASLKDGAAQLADGSDALSGALEQIAVGAAQLADGTATLDEGAAALAAGMTDAGNGAAQLNDGLNTLKANNDTLNQGAETIFAAILSTANDQLAAAGLDAAGITLPQLTADNYAEALSAVLAQLDPEALQTAALEQVQTAVRAQVEASADQVRAAVEQAVQAKVLEAVLTAAQVPMTAEQYAAAVEAKQVPAEQAAQISAAVDAQMATEEVKAQLEQAVQAQIETLVQENTEKYLASDETVAAKLAQAQAAYESLTALKGQLDQINAFVTGLAQYTAGVAQASEGAAVLQAGITQLNGGAAQLAEGAASLKDGAAQLKDGTAQAADGAAQLKDGAAQLAEGSEALAGGAAQLKDGSETLADGAAELKDGAARLQSEGTSQLRATLLDAEKEAAEKLLPYVQNDLSDALRVYEETRDAARNSSYDLTGDDMKSVTVYIIRTDLK